MSQQHLLTNSCSCSHCNTYSGNSRRNFLRNVGGTIAASMITPHLLASPQRKLQLDSGAETAQPILIKGGTVLSLDRSIGDFEKADILIKNGKIAEIRPTINISNAHVIDASKTIVMPGFVDTHRHMWLGYLRNILPDGSFDEYRSLVQRKFGATMTPDDVYAANLLSALGAIDSGVTTVLDWSHISNSPEHSDAAIKALTDSGVRGVFAFGNPQSSTGKYWETRGHKFPEDIVRLRKQYFSSSDQLLTLFMAAPTGAPDVVLPAFKVARDVGAPISIHVGMGEAGRSGLLEKLNAQNALGPDITYLHCCTLNDTEWKLIRDTGGTISISGYAEMLMGHGNPPIQKALDLGILPSLSLDVETTVTNDFFSQMRTILSLQKNEAWAKRLSGDKNPPAFLTVRDVLEFATVQGARANALDRKVGTLTPGKAADIILLRTDLLNVMPMNNAVGAVVTSMGPQNVDTVLIGGKIMKRHGQLVGVDLDRITRLGNEAQERHYRNAHVLKKLL